MIQAFHTKTMKERQIAITTRLVGAHIPLSEVGRVLGHSQVNTTYRYVNANVETAKRAAAARDPFITKTQETAPAPELVH